MGQVGGFGFDVAVWRDAQHAVPESVGQLRLFHRPLPRANRDRILRCLRVRRPGRRRSRQQLRNGLARSSPRQSAVVRIGGATGEPPVASASIDKLSGVVPLTVNIDMSASSDADGTVQYYFFNCGGGSFTPGSQSAQGSCVFTMPGTYWIMLQVQDNSGNVDLISAYA